MRAFILFPLGACALFQGHPHVPAGELPGVLERLQTAGQNHGFVCERTGSDIIMRTMLGDVLSFSVDGKTVVVSVQPNTTDISAEEVAARADELREIGEQLVHETTVTPPASRDSDEPVD